MTRYFIELSFNGTAYHGWQLQDNAHTVQAEVEKALSVICKEKIEVTGCGRTDTGVHAKQYYLHFDIESKLEDLPHLTFQLNSILPDDIVFHKIIPVADDAHARFSAVGRTYRYYVSWEKPVFKKDFCHTVYHKPSIDAMNRIALRLFEYSDFTAFAKLHSDTKTNNCKIMQAQWDEENEQMIFTIEADRFLRNMVRAIVGTLLNAGAGKLDEAGFRKIIESKNRSEAGVSVPAKGLFLEEVKYPEGMLE
ncbi:MAG: tRNA pseudouridine(38-40) synthase TruA [Bacteroidota bacterium]